MVKTVFPLEIRFARGGGFGILLTGLTLSHVGACLKPEL